MSAQADLAGLYAPKGAQVWNYQLPWQPIPVHTGPVGDDYLIAGAVPPSCTAYQNAFQAYQQSPELLADLQKAKPIFDYVSQNLNTTVVESFMTLLLLRDSWVCETAHNLR